VFSHFTCVNYDCSKVRKLGLKAFHRSIQLDDAVAYFATYVKYYRW